MRNSLLTEKDVGELQHERRILPGFVQSMVFSLDDKPPIVQPDAPKYDTPVDGDSVTRKLTKAELKQVLETHGMNGDGNVEQLRGRATLASIPTTETKGRVVEGYVNKPKGAAQILCERGFIDLNGCFPDGSKVTMNGTTTKDPITGSKTINKTTSAIQQLRKCSDFKNEQTQMMYILNLLGVLLILTPKCHPEIAGRGVEYAWGYSKLRFRQDFNDAVAKNLKANVLKSLDREVLDINRIRKFARKAREYKLTYSLMFDMADGGKEAAKKSDIEHITKVFKAHRSAMDADYGFIANV